MTDNWGTTRERSRRRRRWKWVALVVVAAMAAPLLSSFVLGFINGFSGAHDPAQAIETRSHIGYVGMALAVLVALAVQYRLWRNADEVERAQINVALGLAGVVALATLPVLSLAQAPLGLKNPAMIGWGLAVTVLLGTRIVQRLRG